MTLGEGIAASGGRRFVMTMGAGIVSTLLLMVGYIGEQSFVTLQLGTVAAYIVGNVAQKKFEAAE